jgi:pimeloyl-ACP methyl ester carboxylesterase
VKPAGNVDLLRLPDGRELQVWQGGTASGPAVFFLHGCPDTRLAARSGDQPARRTGVRLVALNRPGYGRSSAHVSSQLSVADDVAAAAGLLGIDRFGLLGMSFGGPYALACAVRHPDLVSGVAVVAAPGMVPEMDPPAHRDNLPAQQQELLARLAASSVEHAMEQMRPDFLQYVMRIAPDDPDDVALALRWADGLHPLDAELMAALPAHDVAAMAREALASPEGYLRDAALTLRRWEFRPEQVACPTSLWYGALDPNASTRNARWLAERLPGARVIIRDDTAHLGTLLRSWDAILSELRAAG